MRLLIVGCLGGHITTAGKIALDRGAKVAHVDDLDGALRALRTGQGADLLMVDVVLDIGQLIKSLQAERISVPVVACGIGTDRELAVKAIRAGAKEYVPLPPDAELIAAVLAAVAEETTSFVTRDPAMKQVLQLADQIAPANASVLITGESGTGKEVMARDIHAHSKRASHILVSVNCAAIPENLLESELFGHEKGAFTGAVARRIGKFEEADGSTLLLDEISEMAPRLQAKLLRVIQEREIDRVGGSKPIKVNIRLLATSNRDLEEEVRTGNFREDLYFRLNVIHIAMPPLRQRTQDIEILIDHFIRKYADANDVARPELLPEALEILRGYHWRGNVRELENTLHRAVLLTQNGCIGPEDIHLSGQKLAAPNGDASSVEATMDGTADAASIDEELGTRGLVGRTVAHVEQDLILDTLSHCLGNRTHAANILGISIRTLRNKLKAYGEAGLNITPVRESDRAMA